MIFSYQLHVITKTLDKIPTSSLNVVTTVIVIEWPLLLQCILLLLNVAPIIKSRLLQIQALFFGYQYGQGSSSDIWPEETVSF